MQELRLVAVSEDGSYLVLATAGRGTRFTLPVDDRVRAAVRGHFSRLGQFEIEVESPLRPKEIQVRIRAGETAEEIAESAGIPVERVRWFEGPVLQEREYMAQQAQRVAVRRPGESSPAPPLGEMVGERLGRRGVDAEDVEWDSWKCEDSTWRVRLSFFDNGRPTTAEWGFDPRRRHVTPLDEEAARLSGLVVEEPVVDTVTPLLPRRPAMKIVGDPRALQPEQRSDRTRREYIVERGRIVAPREPAAPPAREDDLGQDEEPAPAGAGPAGPGPHHDEPYQDESYHDHYGEGPADVEPRPGREPVARDPQASGPPEPEEEQEPVEPRAPERADTVATVTSEETAEEAPERAPAVRSFTGEAKITEPKTRIRPAQPYRQAAQARGDGAGAAEPRESEPADAGRTAEAPDESAAAADRDRPRRAAGPDRIHRQEPSEPGPEQVGAEPAAKVKEPAAVNTGESPVTAPAGQPTRPRRKSSRGKRASVPSWDEIMFGSRRPD
ncbi:MAG TPA: septation protein SepH [Actinomadura sp.]|nr:septation protein SepH [Actinomadura sp.]